MSLYNPKTIWWWGSTHRALGNLILLIPGQLCTGLVVPVRGGEEGAMRERYKVGALLLKWSLGLFGLVGRRRVLLPHPGSCQRPPDCPRGSPHSSAHPGTLWCWLSSRLWKCEVVWCGPHLKTTPKTITVAVRRVVRCIEHCPQALNCPDLHFEGAGNGPAVITWIISKKHVLYSGASPISLVEHCVTFRHDRRLLSLLGFVHYRPTSRWYATKKENRFSFNGNGIISSFLG